MISITLSMHDRSRRAAVTLSPETTVGDLLAMCVERWHLEDMSFAVRHVDTNLLLLETDRLDEAGVRDGAELQIFPLLEGGATGFARAKRMTQAGSATARKQGHP